MASSGGDLGAPRRDWTALLGAVLAGAAGLLHLAVVRPHLREGVIEGLLMLAAAWTQIAVAVLLVKAPTRGVRVAAAGVMLAVAAGYVVSRTAGLPFPPYSGEAREARLLGLVTTAAEVAAAVIVLAGLVWRPAVRTRHAALVSGAAGVALAVLVSAALLLTPPGHGHDGGAQSSGGHGHSGGSGGGSRGSPSPSGSPEHPDDGHTHAPGEGHG